MGTSVRAWQAHSMRVNPPLLTRMPCRGRRVLTLHVATDGDRSDIGAETAEIRESFDDSSSKRSERTDRTRKNRLGGRRTSIAGAERASDIDKARTAFSVIAATVTSVLLVDYVTLSSEAAQEWRYTWPSLGIIYVISGLSSALDSGNKPRDGGSTKHGESVGTWDTLGASIRGMSSFVPVPNDPVLGGLAAMAGLGVLVGGYTDAFFPVWYTSPDLLGTRAGIEADSAAILLMFTVCGIFSNLGRYATSGNLTRRDDEKPELVNNVRIPPWAVAAILCTQLWEIASPTFYSWGELLGIVA